MASSIRFVIIGGGLAGAKAVEALRDSGFDGQITLFAEEEHLPYERPPLSKEYLAGKKALTDFTVQNSDWYHDHDVDLRLGARVSAFDPAEHAVALPDGTTVRYEKLLLATGSASRRPPIPGADAEAVHYLRTYDDAVALNSLLSGRVFAGGGGSRVDRPGGGRRCPPAWRRRDRRRDGQTTAGGRARRSGGRSVRQTTSRSRGGLAAAMRRSRRSRRPTAEPPD